jgi:hypothetical protein
MSSPGVNNAVFRRCGSKTEGQNGANRKEKNKRGSGSYKRNTQTGSLQRAAAWTRKLRHTCITSAKLMNLLTWKLRNIDVLLLGPHHCVVGSTITLNVVI